jgi:CheY-like chemotaxis protein
MALKARILVVDDEESLRDSIGKILELHGFEVETASGAEEAIQMLSATAFDVVLTDLRMTGPEDGLRVVRAVRQSHHEVIAFLMSAFPNVTEAAFALNLQADEIIRKPLDIPGLIRKIKDRLAGEIPLTRAVESVAGILERSIEATVNDWLTGVEAEPKLTAIKLSRELRVAYVPKILRDIISRLRSTRVMGSTEVSSAAREHGLLRRQQKYTPAMMVMESRSLQVSIFKTLHNNLEMIDFSVLLLGVMGIADEVDAQLSQSMESYVEGTVGEVQAEGLPALAWDK